MLNDEHKMYCARDKLFWFAINSRLLVFLLQFIFNTISPNYNTDAFISPMNPREPVNIADDIISVAFGGLTRWDGQYFLHIAKYGYTYENTIAFYPLFPLATRYFAQILSIPFFFLNSDSLIIISAILLNFICFVNSALIMFDLSKLILKNVSLAYQATILYCINPASIFFSAIYSESIFALLTFHAMYGSLRYNFFVFLPMSLSIIARSNAVTNIGFLIFAWMKNVLNKIVSAENLTFGLQLKIILYTIFPLLVTVFVSFIPLILLQIINYNTFCLSHSNLTIPLHIVQHANEHKYHLVGKSGHYPPWCSYSLPFAYSYVQSKYWNVGFLKYYELKQIPNFLLAAPIIFLILKCVCKYFEYCKRQPLVKFLLNKTSCSIDGLTSDMLPFIIHGLFLAIFAMFFVHIQVSTRLIASSSPLLYWYCAILMHRQKKMENNVTEKNYEDKENMNSTWRVFFMTIKNYTLTDKLVLLYFFSYIILGSFMFSNFLPWT